jgi:hypothetical protein
MKKTTEVRTYFEIGRKLSNKWFPQERAGRTKQTNPLEKVLKTVTV